MPADPPSFSITVLPAGRAFKAPPGLSILEAAALAGVVLPSSCRNGTCRECLCRLVSGAVRYQIDWPGLSAEEKTGGWILPCSALPESDLVIDQPTAHDAPAADSSAVRRGRGF
jgi:ferredoxin